MGKNKALGHHTSTCFHTRRGLSSVVTLAVVTKPIDRFFPYLSSVHDFHFLESHGVQYRPFSQCGIQGYHALS